MTAITDNATALELERHLESTDPHHGQSATIQFLFSEVIVFLHWLYFVPVKLYSHLLYFKISGTVDG